MKTLIAFCFCFFATETLTAKVSTTTPKDTLVIINEVMYYAVSPYVEFVELFNTSQTDSVRLNGFKLGDANTLSAIEDSGKSIYLKPQQFAVVFGKNRFAAGTSLYNIPAAALRLSVKSADIGNGLNNSGDTVILTDSIGTVLQTFTYSNGAARPNFTLEKVLPIRDNSSSNWQRSLDSLGTAGRRNSVTPFNIGLQNQSLRLLPSDSVVFGTSVTLNDTVRNSGLTTVSNFSVDFFEDTNGNGIPDPSEKFFTQTFSGSLPYNAWTVVVAPLAVLSVGTHRFISVINFPSDENHVNDTARAMLNIFPPPSLADTSVVLSEVMYDPPIGANGITDEYVEVYNTSADSSIDLKNWKIGSSVLSDTGTGKTILPPKSFGLIFGAGYFSDNFYRNQIPNGTLVLKASSTLNLTNTGTTVSLFNARGDTLQRYTYGDSTRKGFSLEKVLMNRNNTASNWGRCTRLGGTPGSRNTLTPFQFNLSISAPALVVVPPATPVVIQATIRNTGTAAFGNGTTVAFFNDLNGNGIPEPSERFDSQTITVNLNPNDSIKLTSQFLPQSPRSSILIVLTNLQDENVSDNQAATLVVVGTPRGTLVINEIMYNPLSGNAEWVEIFNPSTQTVSLKKFKLTDASGQSSAVVDTAYTLASSGYVVIVKDSVFKRTYPAVQNVIFTTSFPSLNNGGDAVVLSDSLGSTVDSLTYTNRWGRTDGGVLQQGRSLEKVNASGSSTDSLNWKGSLDSLGTPGRKNDVVPKTFDLAIQSPARLSVPPQTQAAIGFVVFNRGTSAFGSGTVAKLFEDKNKNRIADPSEEVASLVLSQNILPNDSVSRQFTFQPTTDTTMLILRLINAADEDSTDNTAVTMLFRSTVRNAAVINEIMYSPLQNLRDGRPDQPHYIEIFNRSAFPLNLAGWTIGDSPNERGQSIAFVISDTTAWLYPNEYAAISPDTAASREATRLVQFFTTLQNSSAKLFFVRGRLTFPFSTTDNTVLLRDATGGVVDSVAFSAAWHSPFLSSTTGISLEKINPNFSANDAKSWSSCTDKTFGGTPAKQNSNFATSILPTGSGLVISPNPFSPDGDGHDDNTIISYKLSGTVNRVSIKIFDVKGRLVRTLANSEPSGSSGSFVWNGLDDAGQSLRIGIYIVFLEALNNNAAVQTFKSTVVLARRLR
jgi:hypothetical protein